MSYKKLIESEVLIGLPLDWTGLGQISNISLEKEYPILFERIHKI